MVSSFIQICITNEFHIWHSLDILELVKRLKNNIHRIVLMPLSTKELIKTIFYTCENWLDNENIEKPNIKSVFRCSKFFGRAWWALDLAKIFIHQGWERPRCVTCSIFCSMATLGVLLPPSPKNLGIPRKMYEKERDIIPFKEKIGKKG